MLWFDLNSKNAKSMTSRLVRKPQIIASSSRPVYCISWPSIDCDDEGLEILPSSAPCPPLCALFRPGMNRDMPWLCALGSCESPNLANSPRFLGACCCGLVSSLRPTSSKPSSAVGGSRSKARSLMDVLGMRGKRAESRLARVGISCETGARAETSCSILLGARARLTYHLWGVLSQDTYKGASV